MAVEKQMPSGDERYEKFDVILRAQVGSGVHGTAVEGTDDRDEMGVCLETPDYVIGLRHFEQMVKRDRPAGVRSEPGDLDLIIYGARKFASLALKGNPSILLLFFVPDEECTVLDSRGRYLRESAHLFASRKAGAAFLGYMQQQRQRLHGERGQMNVKRPELLERYGFDTKYAGHIVRLGYQGIDYMTTGRFPVPMTLEQRETILSIRTGQMSENETLTLAGELERDLKDAIDSSPLPAEPDYSGVNQLLENLYWQHWLISG